MRIASTAWTTACSPDPQTRLTVSPGILAGRPALIPACRATFIPAPACRTQPITASPTSSGFTPVRSIASRITIAPRSTAPRSLNTPPNAPIGVRHAPATTTSKSLSMWQLYVLRSIDSGGVHVASRADVLVDGGGGDVAGRCPVETDWGAATDRLPRAGPLRQSHSHRHAAQWSEVFRASERPTGQARFAAARREGGIAQRSRRSARARAPDRAHGVQRQRAFQAGRAREVLRDGGRAPRTARQRVHELRRDGLHVRRAERSTRNRRKSADRAVRLRRRIVADAAGSRQGTRRRDRGVARRARCRLAHPRQAVSDSVLSLAVRGSAADWQAGHHPQRAGRAAAGVL